MPDPAVTDNVVCNDAGTAHHDHRYFRRLITTSIVVIALLLVWHTLHIFLLIFLSVIFGVFLRKTGAWIAHKTGIGVRWGIGIVVLTLILSALVSAWFMAPRITDQVETMIDQLPDSWGQLRHTIGEVRFGDWLMNNMPSLEGIAGSIGGLMHQAAAWLYSAVGALTGALIIFVLGLYFAYDAELFVRGLEKLVSKENRPRAATTLAGVGETLFWWLVGRLISMSIIGVLTMVGLWLMGMPLALTLGLFAAVMTFIPNIGPVIALVPAVLLALQESWTQAAYIVALYTAIQFVESYLITPMVQRRTISMPPALIISAQIIMGVVQGLLGILVATPLVAVIMVLTKRLYLEEEKKEEGGIQAEARTGDGI